MTRTQKSSSLFKTLSRRSLKRDSRSMTLRFETLENRELLSVNPADGAVVATDSNDAAAQLEQNAAEAGSCASIDLSALNLETAAATTETPSAVVTSLLDVVDATDGLITLREALTYAGSEGVVTFSSSLKGGTITLSGAPLTASTSVTIDASALTDSSHSTGITIDANFASRIFDLASGTFELNGLKLVNGLSDKAGAVYIWDNAAVTIKDSVLSGNSASADNSGGAIRLDYSTLAIQNSLIVNNFSTGNYSGGAICNY
ncbi:MAG: hypothetical protein IJL92_00895, partial [Thermoguttaceae bacterium]|nr:hypothetical protein [Thermoguttaceae bacterium]